MFRKLLCLATFIFILASAGHTRGDLVAHWTFDEGSGNVAHDISGNGNDGSFAGSPKWTNGKIGGALEFNGSSDYIEVPFSESLRVINQGDFSIAAWFMLNEIPSEYKAVFQQGDDTSGGPGRTWLFVHQSNEIRSSLGGAPTGSGVGIEGGLWYHGVVVVTEGGETDSVQLYVDGEAAGAPREDSMEDSEGVFYIGAHKGLGNIWDGLLDDIRIYNHALTKTDILAAMEGSEDYPYAFGPNPADGALHPDTWVTLSWSPGDFAVSHDVYLGDNFDEVDNGTGDTFRGNQTTTMFIAGFPGFAYPDGLVPGTIYYWRIDEVNEADPNSPWKGPIWSFSIPPKTAYNPDPPDGAEFVGPDNVTLSWTPGFGAILHTAYFGDNYDEVNNAMGGAPLGSATYQPGPLEAEKVYYWRIDEFDAVETHIGDIWTFTTPGAVGNPQPAYDATDMQLNAILSWTPSDSAASHELYFGTDKEAVRNADAGAPEYKGSKTLGAESYDPGLLGADTTYYWRVDEVDAQGNTSKGPLWLFTTGAFLLVDDFEGYTDDDAAGEAIWQTWIDGFGIADNGAQVGYLLPPYAEQSIVYGGIQSMPLLYVNEAGVTNSEAAMTLTAPRDWTEGGVTELTLWFRGGSGNAAEPLYVAVSNSAGAPAVIAYEDTGAAQMSRWTPWSIALQTFADQGINLTDVDKIAIGMGTKAGLAAPGGSGTLYVDDIRLHQP